MLFRILIASALVALVACARAKQTALIGDWKWQGVDEAGEIHLAPDHSFRLVTHGWTTPPVLDENGRWRVANDQLVLDFNSPYRPKPDEKHIVLAILDMGPDRVSMRSSNRKKTFTLERFR
jgi:hypothetical protein